MKKNTTENIPVEELLKGKKIPILVLDQRWHKLFPGGEKPAEIQALEKELNELLKEQGKRVNTIKGLKTGKKKLMDAIVSGMNEENSDKKKEKQQKLLLETKERIETESERLLDLPYEIKNANERLLVTGIRYCYDKWKNRSEELADLSDEIDIMREQLKAKVAYKVDLEESIDSTYSLMHAILGREVMNLFDKNKL
ncbi:MAG: hypothetical protein HFG35_01490 [Eubacterium sp.]|jgi:hypothetical protein|nr:hypothetical protein [Eubacterium sp.]